MDQFAQSSANQSLQIFDYFKILHPLKGEEGAIEGAKNNHDFGILNFPKGMSVFSSTKFVLKNFKLILPFLGAKEEANYGT